MMLRFYGDQLLQRRTRGSQARLLAKVVGAVAWISLTTTAWRYSRGLLVPPSGPSRIRWAR